MGLKRKIEVDFKEDTRVYFYRTQQGAECDLLLEKNGKIVAAIEIKHGRSPQERFSHFTGRHGAANGYIIGNGEQTYKVDKKITIPPLTHFLKEILPVL